MQHFRQRARDERARASGFRGLSAREHQSAIFILSAAAPRARATSSVARVTELCAPTVRRRELGVNMPATEMPPHERPGRARRHARALIARYRELRRRKLAISRSELDERLYERGESITDRAYAHISSSCLSIAARGDKIISAQAEKYRKSPHSDRYSIAARSITRDFYGVRSASMLSTLITRRRLEFPVSESRDGWFISLDRFRVAAGAALRLLSSLRKYRHLPRSRGS